MNTNNEQKLTNKEAQDITKEQYPFIEFNVHIQNGLEKSTFICLAGSHKAKVNHIEGMVKITVTKSPETLTKGRLSDALKLFVERLEFIDESIYVCEETISLFDERLLKATHGSSNWKSFFASKANVVTALSILSKTKQSISKKVN